jgi:hypothetical protein
MQPRQEGCGRGNWVGGRVEGWKGRVVEKVVDLFSYSHMYELYVRSFHIHAHYCAAGHVGVCV